jgi:DegV family protein with EDD domain
MYNAAQMAVAYFEEECPELAKSINIYVLDSGNYTMSYGYKVIQAAEMAQKGVQAGEIVAFLKDWFSSVETYFSVYNLDFAKKSGRINSTAAFVGDVLGLRPIIRMMDTSNDVIDKVRGTKTLFPRLPRTRSRI